MNHSLTPNSELRSNFDVRYWEMYLTTFLIREGYEVCCPRPGPDVGIKFKDRRIWFEATTPTRGAEGQADQVPAPQRAPADAASCRTLPHARDHDAFDVGVPPLPTGGGDFDTRRLPQSST